MAGFGDCQLSTNIVGETRPYKPLTYIVFMRMQSPITYYQFPITNSPKFMNPEKKTTVGKARKAKIYPKLTGGT